MSVAISVEQLSKFYRLGLIGGHTVRDDVARWWARMLGQPDPLLKIGQKARSGEHIWALKDVDFTVQQGEIVGIIGKNGAGKSTLLKVLSRITAPSGGQVKVRGRIGSLLEVGTGFHPELTGRENVFLNGAILGMRKSEVARKLDEIVDFSGVEEFIDTPVKRYSSGMRVRLAFAVAAYLEPEILLIDEVLAVGDAAFQKKCLGRMEDVSSGGRTVLFVSHNMGMINSLCPRTILLQDGHVRFDGQTSVAVEQYLSFGDEVEQAGVIAWNSAEAPGGDDVRLRRIRLLDPKAEVTETVDLGDATEIEITYDVCNPVRGMRWIVQLKTHEGVVAFAATDHLKNGARDLSPGSYQVSCFVPAHLLNRGRYLVSVNAGIPNVKMLVPPTESLAFSTHGISTHGSFYNDRRWPGVVAPSIEWSEDKVVNAS